MTPQNYYNKKLWYNKTALTDLLKQNFFYLVKLKQKEKNKKWKY